MTHGPPTPPLRDFLIEVSKGNIPGHSIINKFGRNIDVDTAAAEDIWDVGGTFVEPTTARTHDLTSSAAADAGTLVSSGTATGGSITSLVDTGADFVSDGVAVGDMVVNDTNIEHGTVTVVAVTTLTIHQMETDSSKSRTPNASGDAYRVITPASTGASAIKINGLDLLFVEQSEFIILNGVSNVATASTYRMIHRMFVLGAGSGDANAGNITATAQTDATVTAQISTGINQTLMAVYMVPANKRALILCYHCAIDALTATGAADAFLLSKGFGGVYRTRHVGGVIAAGTSHFHHVFPSDVTVPACSIIKLRAAVTANNTDISGGFDILLVDL